MKKKQQGDIHITPGRSPWPHEMRAAQILALAGYHVDFLPEGNLKSADILLDGTEFEIKAPETTKISSIEQIIRAALKQSPNIIIDTSRLKMRDDRAMRFLV